MPIKILFQDEARFGRISSHKRCWAPTGIRPNVNSQIIREFIYAIGAVCPWEGEFESLIMPYVDTTIMSIFLQYIANVYPDHFLIMILDKAGWHNARELKVPEKMKIVFLPPYSPELNPMEHIWDHLRENYFSNIAFDSLDEVENTLCEGLKNLFHNHEMVKSLTKFYWLNSISLM